MQGSGVEEVLQGGTFQDGGKAIRTEHDWLIARYDLPDKEFVELVLLAFFAR